MGLFTTKCIQSFRTQTHIGLKAFIIQAQEMCAYCNCRINLLVIVQFHPQTFFMTWLLEATPLIIGRSFGNPIVMVI